MIVTYTDEGWKVITQRAHGILAAQLAMQWKIKDRPKRWVETVLAIAEHDDAETELDGENLLTSTGGPLNFSMKKFDYNHCNKLSCLTVTKSSYIALLTSMHMDFLYGKEANTNKEAAKFLSSQNKLQTSLRKRTGINKSQANKIYSLVEWCDAFSLIICQDDFPPENRLVDISCGPDKTVHQVHKKNEETIVVEPWPFEENEFEIYYEYRVIKLIQFKSSADFRKAFINSIPTEKKWKVCKK